MSKTITQEQRIRLGKLRERANDLQLQLDKLVEDAEEITGKSEATFDYMLNDMYEVEELLALLDIEVKND